MYTYDIEYHYVGDTKNPTNTRHWFKKRLKNGSLYTIEQIHLIVFTNLEYKKLISKTFSLLLLNRDRSIDYFQVDPKSYKTKFY